MWSNIFYQTDLQVGCFNCLVTWCDRFPVTFEFRPIAFIIDTTPRPFLTPCFRFIMLLIYCCVDDSRSCGRKSRQPSPLQKRSSELEEGSVRASERNQTNLIILYFVRNNHKLLNSICFIFIIINSSHQFYDLISACQHATSLRNSTEEAVFVTRWVPFQSTVCLFWGISSGEHRDGSPSRTLAKSCMCRRKL